MKKINTLILSVIISISLFLLGVLAYETINYTTSANFSFEFQANINSETKAEIKDGKLYDKTTNSLIELNDDSVYDYYKAIELIEKNKYIFVVFSTNQEYLNNSMMVVEYIDEEKDTRLIMLDKESGKCALIPFKDYDETSRIKIDTINFITDDMFIIEAYNLYDSKPNNIGCIKIINDSKVFDTIIMSFNYNIWNKELPLINRYEFTKDSCVIEFVGEDSNYLAIYALDISFNYNLHESDGKYYVQNSHSSFGSQNITEDYDGMINLFEGYYATCNDEIVYLDNELVVRKLIGKKEIETLNSIDDFKNKYM